MAKKQDLAEETTEAKAEDIKPIPEDSPPAKNGIKLTEEITQADLAGSLKGEALALEIARCARLLVGELDAEVPRFVSPWKNRLKQLFPELNRGK